MRLFTALEAPEAWRDEAVRAQQRLAEQCAADLRFVARELLHVTVRFLGEVPPEQAATLVDAIEAQPPFEVDLALAPAGTFGQASRTSVVWLGVTIGERGTATLLETVDGAIRAAGLTPSEQPWRPHLTLARVRRQVEPPRRRAIAGAVRELPTPPPQLTLARGVSLYRSDLGNRAPRHKLLARSAVS